jgi:hypothetical protein
MLNYLVNDVSKIFDHFTDMQLIDIIARVEDWPHEKVYKTAHKESLVEGYPWERFDKSLEPDGGGRLSTPVRLELMRAIEIHMKAGTLKRPRSSSTFFDSKFFKWAMWFLIFYFIVSFFI